MSMLAGCNSKKQFEPFLIDVGVGIGRGRFVAAKPRGEENGRSRGVVGNGRGQHLDRR